MQLFKGLNTHSLAGSTMFVGFNQRTNRGTQDSRADNALCYRGVFMKSPVSNTVACRQRQYAPADGVLCYRGVSVQSPVSNLDFEQQIQRERNNRTVCYRGVHYSK